MAISGGTVTVLILEHGSVGDNGGGQMVVKQGQTYINRAIPSNSAPPWASAITAYKPSQLKDSGTELRKQELEANFRRLKVQMLGIFFWVNLVKSHITIHIT